MRLEEVEQLELPPTADFHVHLRQGAMMESVTPLIEQGGVDTVLVMPNLNPPITTVAQAVEYHSQLQRLSPNTKFLMTLYLHPTITPATVAEAAASGVIAGIKSYPAGVTTNSDAGVLSYEPFYPVFEAMQAHDLVLNLHGELPPPSNFTSSNEEDITILTAERLFLPTLATLHSRFPRLRIVLEHATTAAALAAVRACGPTVVATITAHHLWLTLDDVAGDAHAFCKPVAKTPADRRALLRAATGGDPRFFFGSDSAPHPARAKEGRAKAAAGCFTQPWVTQLVVGAVEEAVRRGWVDEEEVSRDKLVGFLGGFGRRFYKLDGIRKGRIVLENRGERVGDVVSSDDGAVEVVPFRRGEKVWSLRWAGDV